MLSYVYSIVPEFVEDLLQVNASNSLEYNNAYLFLGICKVSKPINTCIFSLKVLMICCSHKFVLHIKNKTKQNKTKQTLSLIYLLDKLGGKHQKMQRPKYYKI